jgi:hypothetical protein
VFLELLKWDNALDCFNVLKTIIDEVKMPKLNRLNFFVLSIVSLCLAILISASPSIANKPRQPRTITFQAPRQLPNPVVPNQSPYPQPYPQQPFQQPIQTIPGTAGCTMTRSDGTTINLDRICGSNVNLPAASDPGAIRASDLEWAPDRR